MTLTIEDIQKLPEGQTFDCKSIHRRRLCVAWTDKDGFAEPRTAGQVTITGPALFCVQKLAYLF